MTQFAAGARSGIGRYFGLISAIPSALLVAWVQLLVASGAWSSGPDLAANILQLRRIEALP